MSKNLFDVKLFSENFRGKSQNFKVLIDLLLLFFFFTHKKTIAFSLNLFPGICVCPVAEKSVLKNRQLRL